MQLPLVVWALSVAFVLGIAAQDPDAFTDTDSDLESPTALPNTTFPSTPTSNEIDTGFLSSPEPSSSPDIYPHPSPSTEISHPSFSTPTTSLSFNLSRTPFPGETPVAATATAVSVPVLSHISNGPIIGAAVGGSIAATLIILVGALFCLRLRERHTRAPSREVESASDVIRLCTALQREVSTLRERVTRLEAREAYSNTPAAVLYTNEKDGLALDGKVAKDHPPTYMD